MEFKNKDPLIICVCGKAGSGKSSVAKYIFNKYKENKLDVIMSPYTKYLKKYISEITGWNMEDQDKPRELLQKISSDLIKNKLGNKDFFINRQIEDIDIYSYFFDIIIIPDVRFPEEIEILKDKYNNLISIGVIRNDYDNGLSENQKNDITETSLDAYENYDYVLNNDGTDKLFKDTLEIIKNIERR